MIIASLNICLCTTVMLPINSYPEVSIFSDHLCAKFSDDTRQCQEIDIGSPLFIKEMDDGGNAR